MNAERSIEDLVDEFETAVKTAAYSDSDPLGDPGNYHKHMERDEALTDLMRAINNLRSALTDAQEIARRGDDIILKLEKTLDAARSSLLAIEKSYASAVNTLQDIAAMGKKAGSESARHRLIELGVDVPDYGSMT